MSLVWISCMNKTWLISHSEHRIDVTLVEKSKTAVGNNSTLEEVL